MMNPAAIPALVLSQASPSAAGVPSGGQMSMFEYLRAGGPLGYVMLGLSVLALALMVRNILALRRSQLVPEGTVDGLRPLLRRGDLAAAARYCSDPSRSNFVTEVMGAAIRRCMGSPIGALEARPAVEEAGQAATIKLHRLNHGIGVLAAVGPMLGLLGTVIGMIGAFHAIGALQGSARSTELARFMSLALVNTAQGLIIAVPCTVAFALFRQRIDKIAMEIGASELEPLSDDLAAGLGGAPSLPSGTSATQPARGGAGLSAAAAAAPAGG
jgi:biopolymer transport protein ExbB